MSLLDRLRAYAAANPTDVAVVSGAVRDGAEIEAYAALAQLSRRWRLRQDAERRRLRAQSRATVHAAAARTLRGLPAPRLDHEPFPLVNRWPLRPARRITPGGD
jgi:hypothetical protein